MRAKFDQLLVFKLDRLGRETRLILNAVAELEKFGVRVRSMTEEFDTATATGRLMLTMLSGFAAHEAGDDPGALSSGYQPGGRSWRLAGRHRTVWLPEGG